jgi:predicted RNA-binding protein associated with RNAse of E/G family
MLERIESGSWQRDPDMGDYRAEWLTDVLVERATLQPHAATRTLGPGMENVVIGQPGFVWARFWFRREGWVVEKYFDQRGRTVGYYAPVCGVIDHQNGRLAVDAYGLGLWQADSGRVTVMGEERFDHGAETGDVTPVVLEQAEQRIRELTTMTAQRRFPPAFVRNFGILLG